MNIPANGTGQVQVTYQMLRTLAARSKDDAVLPSGTLVRVVDHVGALLLWSPWISTARNKGSIHQESR